MSVYMIELLIFAGIAFFIINRLISTLGSTSDDDPAKRDSYFGEPTVRDVTGSDPAASGFSKKRLPNLAEIQSLDGLIVEENLTQIVDGLETLMRRLPSFNAISFLRNVKVAFQMIIEAASKEDRGELFQLVDKRFLDKFEPMIKDYGNFISSSDLQAKFSEIYMFGNAAFIKVLFSGSRVTDTIVQLKEEWTFTRNLITKEVDWFLTNIEK